MSPLHVCEHAEHTVPPEGGREGGSGGRAARPVGGTKAAGPRHGTFPPALETSQVLSAVLVCLLDQVQSAPHTRSLPPPRTRPGGALGRGPFRVPGEIQPPRETDWPGRKTHRCFLPVFCGVCVCVNHNIPGIHETLTETSPSFPHHILVGRRVRRAQGCGGQIHDENVSVQNSSISRRYFPLTPVLT